MIDSKCFTKEWIAAKRLEMPYAADATIEKSIRALALLERLAVSGLPFVFKGGTCMMLHLQSLRRLSVDIDIVCTIPLGERVATLQTISKLPPFTRFNQDHDRNPDRRPNRDHYRFYYDSLDRANPEPYVILDVVYEQMPHPFTEQKPICAPFVETHNPPTITVPTLEALIGDKLTAFAPSTVGVPLYNDSGQQIIKQMFDVGELYDHANSISRIREAHRELFDAENGFRKNQFTLDGALADSKDTALMISQMELAGEVVVERRKRDILRRGISAINVTLTQSEYTLTDARIHASRAALLATLLRAKVDGSLDPFRYSPAMARSLPPSLPPRYAVLNPLREIATEAYHNWNQVAAIEGKA